MELSELKTMLELSGGAAFALEGGRICAATPEAEALGFVPGEAAQGLPAEMGPEAPGSICLKTLKLAGGKTWTLRGMALENWLLCFLSPEKPRVPGPNENSLLHAAGRVRAATQEMTAALDGIADYLPGEDAASRCAALGLRSVYRLRRTASELELFARLRSGSYNLNRQSCYPASRTAALCGEAGELLREAGVRLRCELPERDAVACLDWPLLETMLRELLTNAAAHCRDGEITLRLSRNGRNGLVFAVSNLWDAPLPEELFQRHGEERELAPEGLGLGLSVVSLGASLHGGSMMLSRDEEGRVTALLSVEGGQGSDQSVRSLIQLPGGTEATLEALSWVLPPHCYRLEDLL